MTSFYIRRASTAAVCAGGAMLWGGFPSCEEKVNSSNVAFSPTEFRKFKLRASEAVSHNAKLFRFDLPSDHHETGLVVASCLVAKAVIDGKTVVRPYTPVSLNRKFTSLLFRLVLIFPDQKGYVDLLVKTYPSPGGLMSRHISDDLVPGDYLEMKGPFKKIDYTPNMKQKIGMIAGGTGITPMLQIIREALSNPLDTTEITLIYANVTEDDILLRDELDALQYLYPSFKVYYTLDQPPSTWKSGKGFVSAEMVSSFLPKPNDDCMVLVCGPKGMVSHVAGPKGPKNSQGEVGGLLKALGFKDDQVFKF